MRRSLILAGAVLVVAAPAAAQTGAPGGVGGSPGGGVGGGAVSPFGDGLAGRITGFGDNASSSSPAGSGLSGPDLAASSGAVGSPLGAGSSPFSNSAFRPAGLYLAPSNVGLPSGVEYASAPAATNGTVSGGAGSGSANTAAPRKGTTVFTGGIGPRRFGIK
jgi:hypothetical protein